MLLPAIVVRTAPAARTHSPGASTYGARPSGRSRRGGVRRITVCAPVLVVGIAPAPGVNEPAASSNRAYNTAAEIAVGEPSAVVLATQSPRMHLAGAPVDRAKTRPHESRGYLQPPTILVKLRSGIGLIAKGCRHRGTIADSRTELRGPMAAPVGVAFRTLVLRRELPPLLPPLRASRLRICSGLAGVPPADELISET